MKHSVFALAKILKHEKTSLLLYIGLAEAFARNGDRDCALEACRCFVLYQLRDAGADIELNAVAPHSEQHGNMVIWISSDASTLAERLPGERQAVALSLINRLSNPPEPSAYTLDCLDPDDEDPLPKTPEEALERVESMPCPPIYPCFVAAEEILLRAQQALEAGRLVETLGWLATGLAALDEEWRIAFDDEPEIIEAYAIVMARLVQAARDRA
jgi:hypothetical protein